MTLYDLGEVVGADGAKGDAGNGIQSITKTGTSGKVDTYTITFTDGTSTAFQVTNGSDASVTVDSALSSSSTNPVQNKVINTALAGKAPTSHASSDSAYGLGSTSSYGHVKTINGLTQASHSNGLALAAYQGKVLKDLIDAKSDFSGSYADLTNVPSTFPPSSHTHTKSQITDFPSIPSKTSDLTNNGADGTNIFISNNDNRLSDNRNPLMNPLSATSTNPLDLNNVTDTGFYALLSASSIQYVSNLPSDFGLVSFYLFTLKFNDTYIIQFIVSYNYAKSYVRVKMGNGWNAWKSYLSSDSVVDNLNSTSSTSVLSAKQGKVLADLIGDAITYINQ